MVIFEDGAALGRLLIAATGNFLGSYFNIPIADGVSSVLIGLLLSLVAILLIIESRKLLIGESVLPQTVAEIRELVKSDKNVADLSRPLTMHMAPIDVLLAQDVQFNPELSST